MTLLSERMHAQRLSRHDRAKPADVVRAMGAVQAQDLEGGMWALGVRARCTRADIEEAIARFDIVRTWPMRGTLHFVHRDDVHWMLAFGTPRVRQRAASRYRNLDLDDATFAKAERILTKALTGKKIVARPDIMAALHSGGVSPAGQRGIHIIGELAMRGVLCGGPRVGKQHGFFLLEEFIPKSRRARAAKPLDHTESLKELARRYFESHGPATAQDFAWWAGVRQHDAVVATNIVDGLTLDDATHTYFDGSDRKTKRADVPRALLLPPWDEYTVGYTPKTRAALLDPRCANRAKPSDLLRPVVVVDGLVCGTWSKAGTNLMRPVTPDERRAIDAARERWRSFVVA